MAGYQIRTERSAPTVASQAPFEVMAAALTSPVWPTRVARCSQVTGSKIRTKPLSPMAVSQVPFGAIAIALAAGAVGQGGALLPGHRVPDPHQAFADGGEPGAIRGDRHLPTRHHPCAVPEPTRGPDLVL